MIKRLEQLNTLMELSALINSTLDTGEIRERAIVAAIRLLDAEAGSLILIDQDSGDMFFEVAIGDKGEKTKDKVIGVLEAINRKNGIFDEEDKEALTALANQVAIAVENANLYQELREVFYGTAQALAETIEKRDPYTGGHTKRGMNFRIAIGKAIGVSKKEKEKLRVAG